MIVCMRQNVEAKDSFAKLYSTNKQNIINKQEFFQLYIRTFLYPQGVSMDDDDDLEVQKCCIEEEIRKRKHTNAKAQKEEEERVLIAAAEGIG